MKQSTVVRIRKDLFEKLLLLSNKEDRSITWLTSRAVENYLKVKKAVGDEEIQ